MSCKSYTYIYIYILIIYLGKYFKYGTHTIFFIEKNYYFECVIKLKVNSKSPY
jgi:hypothetical protein